VWERQGQRERQRCCYPDHDHVDPGVDLGRSFGIHRSVGIGRSLGIGRGIGVAWKLGERAGSSEGVDILVER
jgi:hypothetical protein